MPKTGQLEKARLVELWPESASGPLTPRSRAGEQGDAKVVPVQFNPASLKQTFTNQNANSGQAGGSSSQFTGQGSTKLTFELVFDATRPLPEGSPPAGGDVRRLTEAVAYFLTPQGAPGGGANEQLAPPGVRFSWGSFLFDGTMDSLEETIDFFSESGVPLRATLSVGLSKQNLTFQRQAARGGAGGAPGGLPGGLPGVGTQPLAAARAGESLQQLAARAGVSDWQAVARANGIENPRQLAAGTAVNLSARVQVGF
jgi:hypothetical protein